MSDTAKVPESETSPRFRVGCAGMFVLGMDEGYAEERDAWAACLAGPASCEILDTQTDRWMGVSSQEEEVEIRAEFGLPPSPEGGAT